MMMILEVDLETVKSGQSELKVVSIHSFLAHIVDGYLVLRMGNWCSPESGWNFCPESSGWSCGVMIWSLVCDTFPASADDLVPHVCYRALQIRSIS